MYAIVRPEVIINITSTYLIVVFGIVESLWSVAVFLINLV